MPEYFLVPLAAVPARSPPSPRSRRTSAPTPSCQRGFGADYNDTAYPFYPGTARASAGHTESWYFGEPLGPTSATVLLSRPRRRTRSGSECSRPTVRPDGALVAVADRSEPGPGGAPGAVRGVGLSLQVLSGIDPAHRVVVTADGAPYELGGSLSSALRPGAWRVAGFSQGYVVFTSVQPSRTITVRTEAGHQIPVRVLSSSTKSEQIRVRAPTASVVIRSVAWDAGWKGTVSVNGGPARSVTVQAHDLVQEIRIPAGDDVVTFHYRPPHLLPPALLSIGAVLVLLVLLVGWLVVRRRRRGGPSDGRMAATLPMRHSPTTGSDGRGRRRRFRRGGR